MSLRHVWNFRKFWNFVNFWDFKWPFLRNDQKYCQFFFVIFIKDNALLILVEFERDRMSPLESTKNGRIGAHGLNCIIFVKSDFIFEIYDKNYPRKKNFMLSQSLWNFWFLTTRGILAFFTLSGSFRLINFLLIGWSKGQRVQKKRFWKWTEVDWCFWEQKL